jgi:hypothetical protein
MVFPKISALANYGATVIPDLWNLNPFLVILFFALVTLLLFYLVDRAGFYRKNKLDE